VIDLATQTVLQEILRRESRSLLSYVGEAFPWAGADEGEALSLLRQMVRDEGRAVAALGQFLVRRRIGLPYVGPYPTGFTTINFLALDYLLPRLADAERRAIADLERELALIKDEAARRQVQDLLDVKRRHLPALEALAAEHSAVGSRQ
jgi:hypothetical protein